MKIEICSDRLFLPDRFDTIGLKSPSWWKHRIKIYWILHKAQAKTWSANANCDIIITVTTTPSGFLDSLTICHWQRALYHITTTAHQVHSRVTSTLHGPKMKWNILGLEPVRPCSHDTTFRSQMRSWHHMIIKHNHLMSGSSVSLLKARVWINMTPMELWMISTYCSDVRGLSVLALREMKGTQDLTQLKLWRFWL